MDFGLTTQDSHAQINSNINAFYRTTGSFSFLNQIKSIYNGASGSATISADIATLNFRRRNAGKCSDKRSSRIVRHECR